MIYSHNGESDCVLCEVGTEAEGIFVTDEAQSLFSTTYKPRL